MSDIKITAIMPVYNVENFIGKCIESLQAQTLTEWELIAVDDGSPDNSGAICDEYAKKDSRITVIHKENGGAPSARNTAIPKACGEYLYFVDSDDWAEPTMFEDMYNSAKKNNAQLVVAGFYIDTYYSDTEFYTQSQTLPTKEFKSQREFREYAHKMFDKNLLYTPWNKLFERKYIMDNNILFKTTFWDDFPFNLDVVRDVERVVLLENCYYHFMRARADSETAKYRSDMYEKREEEHGWMLDLYKYWNVNSDESREMIYRRYIERVIGCIENVTNSACTLTFREKMQEIKNMITSEQVRKALKIAVPNSLVMKLMLIPIKLKFTFLTYLEGTFISKVKSGNVKLFAKLKANR
ncbi:MAG: glycosyltransferase family 2 protein [Clostridia bacterium]|nr:glycosyltransferase family 2 protein [Clostridia bacterium]